MNVHGVVGALHGPNLSPLLPRPAYVMRLWRRCHYVTKVAMKGGCWTRGCTDHTGGEYLGVRPKQPSHVVGVDSGLELGAKVVTGQWVLPRRYAFDVTTDWLLVGCAGRRTMCEDKVRLKFLLMPHAEYQVTPHASRVKPRLLACAVDPVRLCPIVVRIVRGSTGTATNQCVLCYAMAMKSSVSMSGSNDMLRRVSPGQWLVEETALFDSIGALGIEVEL